MSVIRVSTLEAFRRWRNDEESMIDDLFHVPETEAMKAGTALHKALETSSAGTFDVISSGNYRFKFECDIEIPPMQIKEFRASRKYGDLTVSGQCDGITGLILFDYKTTGFFNAERYLDGYQWRFYLDIFGLDVFRWLVFVIAQDRNDSFLYTVKDFHSLEAQRYPALHADCHALANDFVEFWNVTREAQKTRGEKLGTKNEADIRKNDAP